MKENFTSRGATGVQSTPQRHRVQAPDGVQGQGPGGGPGSKALRSSGVFTKLCSLNDAFNILLVTLDGH